MRAGWLAGTRVCHVHTGAVGTVSGPAGVLHSDPIVVWDHGATITVDGGDVLRSADDWFARALNGDTP